jgi:L-rhamnose isomerase
MEEVIRGNFLGRTHLGLDFFDASINRIAAWVIGTRAAQKSLLFALLEPAGLLREAEAKQDHTLRLALLEEAKTLPLGAVWEEFCRRSEVPGERQWMAEVKAYESEVLSRRG